MSRFIEVPSWSGIAEGYRNPDSANISELILPTVPVMTELFKADYYPIDSLLVAPDNRVGRLDRPPTLDFQAKQREFSVEDYAYDAPLPRFDIERAAQQRANNQMGFDPEIATIEGINELHDMRREIRTAELVFDRNSYLPSQRQVLAGPSQWNTVSSRPVDQIITARDSMLIPPNTLILSRAGMTALVRNWQVIESIYGMGPQSQVREGLVTKQQLSDLLEIPNIIVGDSWRSVADTQDLDRPNSVVKRLWGPHAALLSINRNIKVASGSAQFTFGFRARFGAKRSGRIDDPFMGARGGSWVRVMDQCREIISAPFLGYFFENVVSPSANLSISNEM